MIFSFVVKYIIGKAKLETAVLILSRRVSIAMLKGNSIIISSEFTCNRYYKMMRSERNINVAYALIIRITHTSVGAKKINTFPPMFLVLLTG